MHAITRQVAYPDFIKDDAKLDKFYADVSWQQQLFNVLLNAHVFRYNLQPMQTTTRLATPLVVSSSNRC